MKVLVSPLMPHCFLGDGFVIQDHRPSIVPFNVFTQDKINRGYVEVTCKDVLVTDEEFEALWVKDSETAVAKFDELQAKKAKALSSDADAEKLVAEKLATEAAKTTTK